MGLKLELTDIGEAFAEALDADEKRVMRAAMRAVTQAADIAKTKGRTSIAAGGFSAKWQNALRSKVYPDTPAAFIWHKIGYAPVFEEGATIAGKPYLWLATDAVPGARGGHAMTPAQYSARYGALVSVNVPGKPPMLFAAYERIGAKRQKGVRSAARAGLAGKPLFIGVPQVKIAKKFDVAGAAKEASAELPRLYEQALG